MRERKQEKKPTTSLSPLKSIHLNIVMSSLLLFANLCKSISSSSLACCQSWFEHIGEIPDCPSVQANTVLQSIQNPWSLLLSPGSREKEREARQIYKNERETGKIASESQIRRFATVYFLRSPFNVPKSKTIYHDRHHCTVWRPVQYACAADEECTWLR